MDEPDLGMGDSGEWVTHLQERLHGLALYDGMIDGHYGETTGEAVRKLHEAAGSDHDSTVSTQTWQALTDQEQLAGIGQQDAGTADAGAEEIQPGQLSEDGKWRWDGNEWRPVDAAETAETPHESAPAEQQEEHTIAINEAIDDPATEEAVLV